MGGGHASVCGGGGEGADKMVFMFILQGAQSKSQQVFPLRKLGFVVMNSKALTSPFVITVCFFTTLFCADFWEPRVPYRKINYVTEWYYVGGMMICTLASPQSVPLGVHKIFLTIIRIEEPLHGFTDGFTDSRLFFHHLYPIPIFNDVIMLSVDQIKVTSLILIWILDYVLGDIAHKKSFYSSS